MQAVNRLIRSHSLQILDQFSLRLNSSGSYTVAFQKKIEIILYLHATMPSYLLNGTSYTMSTVNWLKKPHVIFLHSY
jgi:hypothetical protein